MKTSSIETLSHFQKLYYTKIFKKSLTEVMNLKLRLACAVGMGIGLAYLVITTLEFDRLKMSRTVDSLSYSDENQEKDLTRVDNKPVDLLNGPEVDPYDENVIRTLKLKYMEPGLTIEGSQPYNLSYLYNDKRVIPESKRSTHDWSMGQAELVRKIFNGYYEKDDPEVGFFVECGALDGETRSNSLYLEKNWGWHGLLIEADPKNYKEVRWKQRKNSIISNTCLSIKPYPMQVSFQQRRNQGQIAENHVAGEKVFGHVDAQCFPFASYLKALNRNIVDYFSLDVEGAELRVLQTIPFDELSIRTLSVEYFHDPEGKSAVREFMEGKGYFVLTKVTHPMHYANDFIFIKQSFFDTLNSEVQDELSKIKNEFDQTDQ